MPSEEREENMVPGGSGSSRRDFLKAAAGAMGAMAVGAAASPVFAAGREPRAPANVMEWVRRQDLASEVERLSGRKRG